MLYKTSPAPNQTGAALESISYCYDKLHRVVAKGYTFTPAPPVAPQQCLSASPWLPTPAVVYAYDSGTNGVGHLTLMTDQAGTDTYTYDIMGRVSTEQRMIAGISKSIGYSYNLDGSLKTLSYPSGRVITYAPNGAGRLISAVDSNSTQYVSNVTHYPTGAEYQRFMPGIYFRTDVNPRLQVSGFYSDNGQTNSFFMNKTYSYGPTHQNNGNVISITNNKDGNRTQTYTYDSLNRITAGWSTANTGSYSWGENYTIDAWGNLQISPMSGKAQGGNFAHSGTAQNQPAGLGYDAAGNLINYSSPGQYVYDPENRLLSTAGMSYTYDGNGERVLKSQTVGGTPVKRYWSIGGNTLAEADGSGNLTAEYIYFSGKRIARIDLALPGSIHYYLSDHLKSTSIVISAAGIAEEESDYSPFGTEYPITGPGANRYKFTGKERDSESQLDYFVARYYSASIARFLHPDPSGLQSADISNPLSLNLYAYVLDNPLIYTDPSGMECVWDDGSYDSEDDKKTGSVGGCQKEGGTWIELGQNGDWSGSSSGDYAANLRNIVASLQQGNTNEVTATGKDGSTYLTVYQKPQDGQAIVSFTDYSNTINVYAYNNNDPSTATIINKLRDPNGQLANAVKAHNASMLALNPPLDPSNLNDRIQILANDITENYRNTGCYIYNGVSLWNSIYGKVNEYTPGELPPNPTAPLSKAEPVMGPICEGKFF